MKITRRLFSQALVAALVACRLRSATAATESGFLTTPEFSTLAAFVDALLPADDHSPVASALGVPRAVMAAAEKDARVKRIVKFGCHWLDEAAKKAGAANFSALREGPREIIVGATSEPAASPLPKAFFIIVRDLSMRAYYAHAAAWRGMGYDGPPQPDGFLDYRDAPKGGDK